ncbi:hypothetical protein AB0I81_40335 [Nonomuraea sp. NPDC050404]|uniref:hypothetical protein n=1 Tax=Nonomuraea sp. NPDC050404 TaxID=3155783 RepID=UPI0033F951C7
MQPHWHAYTATSNLEERPHPDERWPGTAAFMSSRCAPGKTRHWLARPAGQIVATFDDPEEAADWLVTEYGKIAEFCKFPATEPLEERHARALRILADGEDWEWEEGLLPAQHWTAAVVRCPNRRGDYPCPAPAPPEAGTP